MEPVSDPEAPAEDPLRGSGKEAINEGNPDLEGAAPTASKPEKSQVSDSDAQGVSQQEEKSQDGEGQIREEEEDEGECGFCLFMKSGPCRENFIKWEGCVEEAENAKEDIVSKCHQVTILLKECMENKNNAAYYEPVLRAEKEMGEQAALEEAQETNAGTDSEVPRDQNHAESGSSSEPEKQGVQGGLKSLDEESTSEQPTELQNSEGVQPAHQE